MLPNCQPAGANRGRRLHGGKGLRHYRGPGLHHRRGEARVRLEGRGRGRAHELCHLRERRGRGLLGHVPMIVEA